MDHRSPRSLSWILYLSLAGSALGWGWGWVGIRAALHSYTPGQLALGRYAIASMVLLPFWAWHGARLPTWRHLPIIAVMGVTGFSIYNFCVNRGEVTITAGTAALLGALLPILMALGARYFFAEQLTIMGWLGVFIAFGGVAVTALGAHGSIHFSHSAFLVIMAMVSASIYGLLMKRMLAYYTPLEITTWSIWMGDLALIPLGGGLWKAVLHASPQATLNMLLLGIFPGALCYLLYAYTSSKTHMAQVASWLFLLPLLSILLGWLLLGELPTFMAFVGGAITLSGAYLVNMRGRS
ncbi:MAG: DMT family transporter [Chthoniobacterales bacterium]